MLVCKLIFKLSDFMGIKRKKYQQHEILSLFHQDYFVRFL